MVARHLEGRVCERRLMLARTTGGGQNSRGLGEACLACSGDRRRHGRSRIGAKRPWTRLGLFLLVPVIDKTDTARALWAGGHVDRRDRVVILTQGRRFRCHGCRLIIALVMLVVVVPRKAEACQC